MMWKRNRYTLPPPKPLLAEFDEELILVDVDVRRIKVAMCNEILLLVVCSLLNEDDDEDEDK